MTGDLTLGGHFEILLPPGFDIEQGDSFEPITVDGSSTGSFAGYAECAFVDTFDGEDLYLTYAGGDGNDVVLYTLPEPGLAVGLAFGFVTLVIARRRPYPVDARRR